MRLINWITRKSCFCILPAALYVLSRVTLCTGSFFLSRSMFHMLLMTSRSCFITRFWTHLFAFPVHLQVRVLCRSAQDPVCPRRFRRARTFACVPLSVRCDEPRAHLAPVRALALPSAWFMGRRRSLSCRPASTVFYIAYLSGKTLRIPSSSHRSPTDRPSIPPSR